MFACMGDKPVQTEYFSRMSVAGFKGEEYGHTGQGFSYLWTMLGANMGGPHGGGGIPEENALGPGPEAPLRRLVCL